MPTLGGVSCDLVHGDIPDRMVEVSHRWHTPGVNGEGIVLTGRRGQPYTLVAVKYDTEANINSWSLSLSALEGTIAAVTNDWGDTDSPFIERCHPIKKTAIKIPGSSTDCRGEIRLDCIMVE